MFNPRQMQRTNVVGFELRSVLFSSACLTVLAQDLCYSDPLSLVLTFLTPHNGCEDSFIGCSSSQLVHALHALDVPEPTTTKEQPPKHKRDPDTDTDTQTHRHTDTQTHRRTDTQTQRHTDERGTMATPRLPLLFSMCRSDTLTLSRRSCLPLSTLMRHWQVWSHHSCHQS